jgi:hypothetical protein
MELLAVGNLLVADHQRVEIVILQKLEEELETPSPRVYLVELLKESGFAPLVLKTILSAAITRDFKTTDDFTDDEVLVAIGAVEAAIADDEQMREEDND